MINQAFFLVSIESGKIIGKVYKIYTLNTESIIPTPNKKTKFYEIMKNNFPAPSEHNVTNQSQRA